MYVQICVCAQLFSSVWLFGLWPARLLCPWNISGKLPFPPPGDLPDPGIKHVSWISCIGRWILLPLCHQGSPVCTHMYICIIYYISPYYGQWHTYVQVSKMTFNYHCHKSRRRQWHPTPVLLPGKSHGWRSLVGCNPWGHQESDTTARLHFHFLLSCIGEGNGNPLQCSCLQNPRDGGAWWAAVCGVTQSQTRLKWLSSHKSTKSTVTV